MIKVLVLYYSQSGSTRSLAHLIARGIEKQGAEAIIRTVPPVTAKVEAQHNTIPAEGDLYANKQDLIDCDGLVVGSPTRFGNMASALKYFIDSTSEIWMNGQLADKPVSFFTSTGSLHGGQESTLLSMMNPFLHHGMLVCGLPYRETSLIHTRTGGTPYGVSHWAGQHGEQAISEHERTLAIAQGERVARFARKLAKKD